MREQIKSWKYEVFFAIMYSYQFILFLSALILVSNNMMEDFDFHWTLAASVLNVFFLADVLLNLLCFGLIDTLKNWEFVLELILQSLAWVFAVLFLIEEFRGDTKT